MSNTVILVLGWGAIGFSVVGGFVVFFMLLRMFLDRGSNAERIKNVSLGSSLDSSLDSRAIPNPNPIYPLKRRFTYSELRIRRKQHLQRWLTERVDLHTSSYCASFRAYNDYLKWCEKQHVPEKERYYKIDGFSRVLGNWGQNHGRKWIQDKQYRCLLNFYLLPDPDERFDVSF